MTFEQFAERALALQAEQLAESREQTRLIRRLCAALGVEVIHQRVKHRADAQRAAAGGVAASLARRKLKRVG